MLVVPSEVAAWAKFRLGHVSPGTDACQFTRTANSFASLDRTGDSPSEKQFMMSSGRGSTGLGRRLTQFQTVVSARSTVPATRSSRLLRRIEPPAIFSA